MIAWVVEAALAAKRLSGVCVATDSEEILKAAMEAGAKGVLTDPDLPSGTDRIAAAAREFGADLYLNVQGDEPLIDPRDLNRLVAAFDGENPPAMATLARTAPSGCEVGSPDLVKVVRAANGDALYFSRSPIPYYREPESDALPTLLHVGVYAYTARALEDFTKLCPSPLERAEKLEQLRALEAGWRIRVIDAVGAPGVGVDRPEDAARAEKQLAERLASREQEL